MKPELLQIIGTAHVSKESIREVRETILETKPDVVAVELDLNRYKNLLNERMGETDKKDIKIRELIKGDQLTLFLVSMFLTYMQKKIGDDLGVKPGSEMMAAIDVAGEVGAKVAFIDRDIRITLKRTIDQMSFFEKIKFLYGILASFFSTDEALEDIEDLKQGDALLEAMKYFQEMSPKAYNALVTERDAYMARMILDIPEDKVVAVVGAGHQKGIKDYLKNSKKIPPFSELLKVQKSRISPGKLILFAIPVIFILIFALALLNGINIKTSLFEFVMLTGGLSFIGSILSGSKIYSGITAFLVAPITSIHPLLAAGWFAGIVEAKIRGVSAEDLVGLSKCESFRELWGNNLFRILMVVVGANIGCTIGTLLSIPNVLVPLLNKIMGF